MLILISMTLTCMPSLLTPGEAYGWVGGGDVLHHAPHMLPHIIIIVRCLLPGSVAWLGWCKVWHEAEVHEGTQVQLAMMPAQSIASAKGQTISPLTTTFWVPRMENVGFQVMKDVVVQKARGWVVCVCVIQRNGWAGRRTGHRSLGFCSLADHVRYRWPQLH
jgi:hypothetical protein